MINRIVKMSFKPEEVGAFLKMFDEVKDQIANFDGCEGLILLRDAAETNVFFTYSYWQSEAHLNKYRFSDLFKGVWSNTKIHFNQAPAAWSLLVERFVK